jgi:hypothetical protein
MQDTIILPIKKVWFDMIKAGVKKEEYRVIKMYYAKRFFIDGQDVLEQGVLKRIDSEDIISDLPNYGFVKKERFKKVEFRNGYGKSVPSITLELLDIVVATGVEEWGAVKGEFYFTLQLGKLLTK